MSVEQYSNEVIVVTIADGPSNFKVWLREETPADLLSDLRWLYEEYMDSHVVLDLADLGSLEAASYQLMLNLQELGEESDFRFVVCGVSPRLQCQLYCTHLAKELDTFDTREAAILKLAPQDAY
jgi:anti-anti-sigma regulatory factor